MTTAQSPNYLHHFFHESLKVNHLTYSHPNKSIFPHGLCTINVPTHEKYTWHTSHFVYHLTVNFKPFNSAPLSKPASSSPMPRTHLMPRATKWTRIWMADGDQPAKDRPVGSKSRKNASPAGRHGPTSRLFKHSATAVANFFVHYCIMLIVDE